MNRTIWTFSIEKGFREAAIPFTDEQASSSESMLAAGLGLLAKFGDEWAEVWSVPPAITSFRFLIDIPDWGWILVLDLPSLLRFFQENCALFHLMQGNKNIGAVNNAIEDALNRLPVGRDGWAIK